MSARRFTDADRKRAVELFATHGPTVAAAEVGATPRSVQRWALAAGVASPEERRRKTAEARAEIERRQAEAHATLAPTLTHIASLSLAAQLEVAQLVTDVLRQARGGSVSAELMARVSAVQAVVGTLTPRTLVAFSTRAIHDLQLLTGGDTERTSGEVRVFLAKLANADEPGGDPVIVDLAVVRDSRTG